MSEPQQVPRIDDPALAKALETFGAAIETREKTEGRKQPEPKPTAKVIQLPLWADPVRGVPNSVLRSALFAAIQGKTRTHLWKHLLGSLDGVTIRYTGDQLDQSDLDVWEHAVHLARSHPLGNICHFTAHGFLKALGRNTGKSDYQWLEDVFTRLVACEVMLKTEKQAYGGNLVHTWKRDEHTNVYKLSLNPDIIKLYGANDWTAINWTQRQALRRKPLALWLHGFYSTHAQPYPIKVETIQQLSGSANKQAPGFKRQLKAALADLEAATGIKAQIEGDLVTVERQPSGSQARHIIRKISRQHPNKRH